MIRTQIQLTEEQARAVRALAEKSGVSMAEVIRRAVDQALLSPLVSDEERRRRALAWAGRSRSGLPDLGLEHDRYLDEAYADWDPA